MAAHDNSEQAIMAAIQAAVASAQAGQDPGDVAWIVGHLHSDDDWVAATAAEAIGPLGLQAGIDALAQLLSSGPESPPATLSTEDIYPQAAVQLERVAVRAGAARSLGRLLASPAADQGSGLEVVERVARAAVQSAADDPAEHVSVRAAARAALYSDGTPQEFLNAQAHMTTLASRIDQQAGLISEARDYGHRMSEERRQQAVVALKQRNNDQIELSALVAWARGRHRDEMLQWAGPR